MMRLRVGGAAVGGAKRKRADVPRTVALLVCTAVLSGAWPLLRAEEPLDLAALLAEAEERSPEILAARARVEALSHVPSQTEALPDPTASVAYTNDGLDRFTLGEREFAVLALTWTQEFPYPGKRRLAGDVARAQTDVARQEIEAMRLRVLSEIKGTYAELHRLDRTLALLEESRKLLLSFRDAARARYETGEGILENVLKAETEIGRLEAEFETLRQERRAAEVALNALVGRPADTPLGPALLAPRAEMPDPAIVERAALDRSPDLARFRAAVRREETRVELAKKNQKPDLMWSASYQYRGNLDPMVMGMFGARLPFYAKRKQAELVAQSRYELDASRRELEGREVAILSEVRNLLARARRADALVRLYGEGIVTRARSTLDAAAAAYTTGRTDFLTVVQDFRAVLDDQVTLEVERAEKGKALAALEPLTGATLVKPGSVEQEAEGSSDE